MIGDVREAYPHFACGAIPLAALNFYGSLHSKGDQAASLLLDSKLTPARTRKVLLEARVLSLYRMPWGSTIPG